jgi:hypothetical protein
MVDCEYASVSRLELFPFLIIKRQHRFSFQKNGARGARFVAQGHYLNDVIKSNCGASHVINASDWTS